MRKISSHLFPSRKTSPISEQTLEERPYSESTIRKSDNTTPDFFSANNDENNDDGHCEHCDGEEKKLKCRGRVIIGLTLVFLLLLAIDSALLSLVMYCMGYFEFGGNTTTTGTPDDTKDTNVTSSTCTPQAALRHSTLSTELNGQLLQPGQTVEYNCSLGFSPKCGTLTRVCTVTGQMNEGPPVCVVECKDGMWFAAVQKCFVRLLGPRTFVNATRACAALGNCTLPILQTPADMAAFYEYRRQTMIEKYWLGLKKPEQTLSDWRWVNDQAIGWTNWNRDTGESSHRTKDCIVVHYNKYWEIADCKLVPFAAICQCQYRYRV